MTFVVRIVLLAGLVWTSAPLAAQPLLTVEPDTLFFITSEDNEVLVWNAGTDTLHVDSLRFTRRSGWGSWDVQMTTPDDEYSLQYLKGELYPPPPEQTFPPLCWVR